MDGHGSQGAGSTAISSDPQTAASSSTGGGVFRASNPRRPYLTSAPVFALPDVAGEQAEAEQAQALEAAATNPAADISAVFFEALENLPDDWIVPTGDEGLRAAPANTGIQVIIHSAISMTHFDMEITLPDTRDGFRTVIVAITTGGWEEALYTAAHVRHFARIAWRTGVRQFVKWVSEENLAN